MDSVWLPGAAWATKIAVASSDTSWLRASVSFCVVRVASGGKGDRTRSRPCSMGVRQARGRRGRSRLRAGQTTIGWVPRSSKLRHSCSIGEWKPLMTLTLASRRARARSYRRTMASLTQRRQCVSVTTEDLLLESLKRLALSQSIQTRKTFSKATRGLCIDIASCAALAEESHHRAFGVFNAVGMARRVGRNRMRWPRQRAGEHGFVEQQP